MHSGISNIQHAPAYSHSSAIEQIHMSMSNYHDQTNTIYPKNIHEASYVSGPNNFRHGVSSFYSLVENSHCINLSRHICRWMRELANLILISRTIILSAHMLHHTLLKRRLRLHVQLHMLVVISMIWPFMLAMTIAELMNTHQTYAHLHLLL
jgi:hypothetical protein